MKIQNMSKVPSDIEIAQAANKKPISDVAAKLGLTPDDIIPFGHDKAKISYDFLKGLDNRQDGKLILVTAISPTPAGEGKTTTTVGLGDGLNAIGKNAVMCLREPSLGPCFGMKGGAAGGGYAQVVPISTCISQATFTLSARHTTCCRHSSTITCTGTTS